MGSWWAMFWHSTLICIFASQPQIAKITRVGGSTDLPAVFGELGMCHVTEEDQHKARMQRLKASVDRRIEAAQRRERSADCLHGRRQGEDHGRAGYGLTMSRPWYEGRSGAVHQGRNRYGRGAGSQVLRRSRHLSSHGRRVYLETQDRERDTRFAQEAWGKVCVFLRDPSYSMVILDEFNIALQHDYVRLEDILPILRGRPPCSMW